MSTSQSKPDTKSPSHIAYHVRDRKGDKSIWTRIGAAWQHADGKGFNLQLSTVALNGKVVLRIDAQAAA